MADGCDDGAFVRHPSRAWCGHNVLRLWLSNLAVARRRTPVRLAWHPRPNDLCRSRDQAGDGTYSRAFKSSRSGRVSRDYRTVAGCGGPARSQLAIGAPYLLAKCEVETPPSR